MGRTERSAVIATPRHSARFAYDDLVVVPSDKCGSKRWGGVDLSMSLEVVNRSITPNAHFKS